jgi:hypothetical protein|nr:MAG TPA: hypothetical protein [Caudoviricetes sp.]
MKYLKELAWKFPLNAMRFNEACKKITQILGGNIAWLEKQGKQKKQVHFPKFTFDDLLALQCCMETVKKVQEDKELYEQLNLIHSKMCEAYWIEKKGEQTNECAKNEQKSTDKIEPRFKVGDRIRHKETNKDDVYEISKVYDDSYGIAGFTWMIYMKYQDQYELVPNKFDPKTLKPFDKVLVKYSANRQWKCDLFSDVNDYLNYPYRCISCSYKCCIPYNEDTKHLLGTTDDAPEYYKYWED